ncbi:DISARM system phospholipase D-like protein DrmC [Streptomyces sp. NPDC057249]|uniref:DISARM system phospholipase D-like protein DrmC n=1 Tax=Streptomyces sp. NPDC057249 TaxID=3346067 RepID=UPI00362A7D8A
MTGRLPVLLAGLARRLPPDRLADLLHRLDEVEGPDSPLLDRWSSDHPAAGLAVELSALRQAWREERPLLPGAALALSLASATAAGSAVAPPAELVVSGPTSPAIPVRLTSAIATDVIRSARTSLLIASFAAYDIHEIVGELRGAAARDVRIDLLLEESTSAARAFGPLRKHVRVWHRADRGNRTALHAKVIAADRHTALLGSANLTGRGLERNIEIGVILNDSPTVGRLVDHLRWLTGPEGLLRQV